MRSQFCIGDIFFVADMHLVNYIQIYINNEYSL